MTAADLFPRRRPLPRRALHRRDDLRIGGAATEVAGEPVLDRVVVRIGMAVEQLLGHEDEPGRAEAALERALLDEGLLHRIEAAVRVERLDRRHLGAVREGGEIETARHRGAVDEHGAAAAQALAAALARAVERELVAQHLEDGVVRRDLGADRLAVEGEADDAAGHNYSSPSGSL